MPWVLSRLWVNKPTGWQRRQKCNCLPHLHQCRPQLPRMVSGRQLSCLCAFSCCWHKPDPCHYPWAQTHACCRPQLVLALRSDGDPAVCSRCADGMAPDLGTGMCTPCRLVNARDNTTCSEKDAARCDYDDDCAEGFYCHNVTGQCTACPATSCKACYNPEPQKCSECLHGYWDASQPIDDRAYTGRSDGPTNCEPCDDTNCLICTISRGAACELCADGYFLDFQAKRCRAVGGCCWLRPRILYVHACSLALCGAWRQTDVLHRSEQHIHNLPPLLFVAAVHRA